MAYFSDLPIDNNATIDVYALLRTQFLSAIKAKREIENRLKGMTDPGEIRFYKKRVKYTPKGASKPRVYEYNCHYIRTEEKVLDKKNREKTRHSTRFLKNDKYEEKKQASALYHFLKGQLEDVIKMINRVKEMILSGFYHHPDDIPDLIEEEELVYKEMSRSDDSREDHLSQRYAWASDKYKCINKNAEAFMSRGETLFWSAVSHRNMKRVLNCIRQIKIPSPVCRTPTKKFFILILSVRVPEKHTISSILVR